jgi:hypothetical protein
MAEPAVNIDQIKIQILDAITRTLNDLSNNAINYEQASHRISEAHDLAHEIFPPRLERSIGWFQIETVAELENQKQMCIENLSDALANIDTPLLATHLGYVVSRLSMISFYFSHRN